MGLPVAWASKRQGAALRSPAAPALESATGEMIPWKPSRAG